MSADELRPIIAADCPNQRSISIYDRCGVQAPQLPAIFG
jgi:hypothetical protein